MKFNELIRTCDDEKLERMLNAIVEERKHRRRVKARDTAARIRVGDMVRLTDIRPKYMTQCICEVTGFANTKVIVKIISGPSFRGRATTDIRVPANCIIPIADDVDALLTPKGD